MGNLKVREVKGMTSAPEIFITWLERKNIQNSFTCVCIYTFIFDIQISYFTYILPREELQGIKKRRITSFMWTYLVDWIQSKWVITFKIKEESSW